MPGDSPAVILYDATGNALAVSDGVTIPASTKGLLFHGKDIEGKAALPHVLHQSGFDSLSVVGSVSVVPPMSPPGTTVVTIAADMPLDISGVVDTEYVIPDETTFHLQQITAGAEGDPTEKGSKIDVLYYDGAIEHIIDRLYVSGFTTTVSYPSIGEARDGTDLLGNGSTKKIVVRRIRLSGTSQEVDAVVRGHLQT